MHMREGILKGSEGKIDTSLLSDIKCVGAYEDSGETVTVRLKLVSEQVRAQCPHLGEGYGKGHRCANLDTGAGIGSQPSNYQTALCTKIDRI